MAVDTNHLVHDLNGILRGEISAAETYKKAIDRIDAAGKHTEFHEVLHQMQREHGIAAQQLRARINDLGGQADNDSGAWGVWANLVEGTATMLGDAASLKALKEGEEHGLKDYERTLEHDVDQTTRTLLSTLREQQRRHIATLDRLLSAV